MSVFAHASREEKIVSSFQRLWARARVFHPFSMPCKLRTPFTLTFFVMFRHTCFINRTGTYFNRDLVAPTVLYTNHSTGPNRTFMTSAANGSKEPTLPFFCEAANGRC